MAARPPTIIGHFGSEIVFGPRHSPTYRPPQEARMIRKQILVAAGMAAAVAVVLLLYGSGAAQRFPTPLGDDEAARLAFAARWLLVPALCLLVGIGVTANRRFFIADAIDGARDNPALEINLRYNQYTLEQGVLAADAWTGLALALR